uniref:BARNASE MCOEETI FUSION n=1 Tax=Bacillus amyloliquefaciens TaxID=1390 RepID=UPI00006036F9|nr:Chain A, BARNASE MCOEETI FUSION [synthetic construct]2C4B_B Chain B, BARNASE MCOEETI FUSION [synthetic construct]
QVINTFDGVADYLQTYHKLPDNYITKSEAQALGWVASKGNLADVAPGKSIGGDIFSNREGKLPGKSGRTWREADINYTSGFRNSDRILYSSDWLIYKTTDAYQTFTKIRSSSMGVCPKILKKCRRDSDCLAGCVCGPNGFCGS